MAIGPTLQNGRSETEILSRAGIPVTLGDVAYSLRPLTMAKSEEWEGRIRGLISEALGSLGDQGGGVEGILAVVHQSVSAGLDALYAYDELGGVPSLPDREFLFNHASRDDLTGALRKLVEHEFPFLKSAETLSAWLPSEVRTIITNRLLMLAVEPSPQVPSLSASPPVIPGRAARRRSAKR